MNMQHTCLGAIVLASACLAQQPIMIGGVEYVKLATRDATEQRMLGVLSGEGDLSWGPWHLLGPFPGNEKGMLSRPFEPEKELEKMVAGGPGPDLGV
jgi:hypothetical protein